MRPFVIYTLVIYAVVQIAMSMTSCKHEPLTDLLNPGDTIPIDTVPIDTGDTIVGVPCDPDVVYFNQQVLPILISNCAFSGCHDAASHEDGVILTDYEKVMQTADVEPFNLDGSEIYSVLIEDDPDKRMPLDRPSLSADQIQLVAKWILQGAKNEECDQSAGGCDTVSVSFAQFVKPVIQNQCQGCHSGAAPSGGVDLSTYQGVKSQALNGKLHGVTAWLSGYKKMPFGSSQLSDCTVDKIKAWVDAGALEN